MGILPEYATALCTSTLAGRLSNRKRNKPLSNDTQITEFRKLNEAAIRYVERTEQMFEQQKQFIGNASHEIQTPLAICRNRLEMLMEDDSLSEKQLEELMKTHQTLEYITKLNKSLLLLSKIDNGQFTDTKELELNVLLKQYLQDYEEVYDYRNIEVTIDEQGVFKVTMNESLAVALLTNLLKMHLYIILTGDISESPLLRTALLSEIREWNIR